MDAEEDEYLAKFINKDQPVSLLQTGHGEAGHGSSRSETFSNFSHLLQVLKKIDCPARSCAKRTYVEEDNEEEEKEKKSEFKSKRVITM